MDGTLLQLVGGAVALAFAFGIFSWARSQNVEWGFAGVGVVMVVFLLGLGGIGALLGGALGWLRRGDS